MRKPYVCRLGGATHLAVARSQDQVETYVRLFYGSIDEISWPEFYATRAKKMTDGLNPFELSQ